MVLADRRTCDSESDALGRQRPPFSAWPATRVLRPRTFALRLIVAARFAGLIEASVRKSGRRERAGRARVELPGLLDRCGLRRHTPVVHRGATESEGLPRRPPVADFHVGGSRPAVATGRLAPLLWIQPVVCVSGRRDERE